jgi:hypothetical protein
MSMLRSQCTRDTLGCSLVLLLTYVIIPKVNYNLSSPLTFWEIHYFYE